MAKLIRFLSGRWTTRQNGRPPPPQPGATGAGGDRSRQQRSRSADRNLLLCRVALLDGTETVVDVPKRSLGSVLYEKIFRFLDIIETEYFGLQFIDDFGVNSWLDSAKSIKRQIHSERNSSDQVYSFQFRVKFYSSDPNNLKDEVTRYQFYLQLKSDVESGRLRCSNEAAVDLAALVLQAELGDFDEQEHSLAVVSEFRFAPIQNEEFEREVLKKFKTLHGMSPARCELLFLNKAKCLELYGVDFYSVLGKDENEYRLGLMPKGILVCEASQKIGLFSWPKITKLQFKKKRLLLEVVESDDKGFEQEHTFVFRLSSERACKNLWRCAVEHHAFFRLSSPIKPYGLKSGFLRFGSRLRCSGNTEVQTINRPVAYRDVILQRRPSRRHSRRERYERSNCDAEERLLVQSKHRSRKGSTGSVSKTKEPPLLQRTSTLQNQRSVRDHSANQKSVGGDHRLLPVQVTVSTQESFDEDSDRRFQSIGYSQATNGRQMASNRRREMSPQNTTLVTSSGDAAYVRGRSRRSLAAAADDDGAYARRRSSSTAIDEYATNQRRRQSVTPDEQQHRQQTTRRTTTARQPPDNFSASVVMYNSMPMQRGRNRSATNRRTEQRQMSTHRSFNSLHQSVYDGPAHRQQRFEEAHPEDAFLTRQQHNPPPNARTGGGRLHGSGFAVPQTLGVSNSYSSDLWSSEGRVGFRPHQHQLLSSNNFVDHYQTQTHRANLATQV